MSSLFLRTRFDSTSYPIWIAPATLFITSLLAPIHNASSHSLLIDTIAWSALCIICTWRTSLKGLLDLRSRKLAAYGAGLLWAVSEVCERAVDGENLWWTKAFLPIIIHLVIAAGIYDVATPTTPATAEKERRSSVLTLASLTVCAVAASWQSGQSHAVFALGLSYAFLAPVILLLIERAHREASNPRQNGNVIYSTSGLLAQAPTVEYTESITSVVRDVALVAASISGIAAIAWEPWNFAGISSWGTLGRVFGDHWVFITGVLDVIHAILAVPLQAGLYTALIYMVYSQKVFITSLVITAAFILVQLFTDFTAGRLWFSALFGTFLYIFHDDRRGSRLATILTILSLIVWIASTLYTPPVYEIPPAPPQYFDSNSHPIDYLSTHAASEWRNTLASQSRTLEAAVLEYQRRYAMPPPPNFDKWYEFATKRNVQLIDEYDSIYHSLRPFFSLPPATIRARTREILGFKANNLIGFLIRDGKVVEIEGGVDWQQRATLGMMEKFVRHLPDMDLAFNIHDEPRVVVPHDMLSGMISAMPSPTMPKNQFSRAQDLDGRIEEVKTTRFNTMAHQPVWELSKLSCPPTSPAREFGGNDNLTAYAMGELGFISNHTAFTDVCNTPSMAVSHGFFDRPNAANFIHDLVPIFSQSKMSSFQDILYPSPWYWYEKVKYDEGHDKTWEKKEDKLWWRGSTTGGFSRDGGWRRQHRQRLVATINSIDQAKIMRPSWTVQEVPRQDYKQYMDVFFSHVGQCDPGDCDAQREFFTIAEMADQQEAWNYKYLLDVDGNAFSGRFYAFLQSHSQTFKLNVFREWHEEWIKPWVHYVPLSLRGEDVLETVRFYAEDGEQTAGQMAEESRAWAGKALRKEDFEAFFFRLLLEYGRIVDDQRDHIGFAL